MAAAPAAPFTLAPRRAWHLTIDDTATASGPPPDPAWIEALERYDLLYRTVCGILYNYVPTSGHPGGSISSGRIVAALLFGGMDYDIGDPNRPDADILSYAAGHKAMGLYAMWALRNELVRAAEPGALPRAEFQLRLEDLLGFRRNPTQRTPLFVAFRAKPLDGHPTPATPFVRLSTGASGVGVPASLGLALGAIDAYGTAQAPMVHILEGEGGMTAGRVSEALAIAATARLGNAVLHLDWNQASIDSNRVCREGDQPGDYVQWDPAELAYLHDWNLVRVADGKDFRQVLQAQRLIRERANGQPTAICYRTVKGWQYGIEGKSSHGAGHKFCSPEYYAMLGPCEQAFGTAFPRFDGENTPDRVEQSFWDTLLTVRKIIEAGREWAMPLAAAVLEGGTRLAGRKRSWRTDGPDLSPLFGHDGADAAGTAGAAGEPSAGGARGAAAGGSGGTGAAPAFRATEIPEPLRLAPGTVATLRGALGDTLNFLNEATRGAILGGAADLLGSTSISNLAKGFPSGFFNAIDNPGSRLVACGGICEDAMGGVMAGLSAFGRHIGSGASYGAFIAALQHVPARLHAIGQQSRRDLTGEAYHPFLIVCAHAGLKTGEDGPTHADPQALQLLQENFPRGAAITLTPWEPQELWPLTVAGLQHRPAVLAPFVTRPNEKVPDRAALRLPPATAAAEGLVALRTADPSARPYHGAVILQESGVVYGFVDTVLPEIDRRGLRMNIYVVTSAELFELLPEARRAELLPAAIPGHAMGITGFTLPTLHRWIRSEEGLRRTLHPYRHARYPGSGQAEKVLEEAGLDGASQRAAVLEYAAWMEARTA